MKSLFNSIPTPLSLLRTGTGLPLSNLLIPYGLAPRYTSVTSKVDLCPAIPVSSMKNLTLMFLVPGSIEFRPVGSSIAERPLAEGCPK